MISDQYIIQLHIFRKKIILCRPTWEIKLQ